MVASQTGQGALPPGEGTIYLEPQKDDKGNAIWSLLGGNATQGSSHWFRP
jgi:hypothetical protein